MKHPIPEEAFNSHIACLGKTGSGKTTTAKGLVEHILRADKNARVCILDPIKSDWWGMTSSADGQRSGLPFAILGGPRGHVQLHASAGAVIGELVAKGQLPLSIIDMADFGMGGLQQFFNDFAPALMRHIKGIVTLVMEEAHEFAPKERVGAVGENMTVYHAKRLATAGRSKGLRLIVVTQATQQLHNRVLGSCETMIAHRFTTPADQKPIKDWLKANFDKTTFEKVGDSLSRLKTGTGWVCSGELQIADLVEFPALRTFDNSKTPAASDDAAEVKTAPIDHDKLRAIIGDAAVQAESKDVGKLQKRIEELEAENRGLLADAEDMADPVFTGFTQADLDRAHIKGIQETCESFDAIIQSYGNNAREILLTMLSQIDEKKKQAEAGTIASAAPFVPPSPARYSSLAKGERVAISGVKPAKMNGAAVVSYVHGALTKPQQRVLDALAWWASIGHDRVSREQVAVIADYTPTSGGFGNLIGQLKTMELLEFPGPGDVSMTSKGIRSANRPAAPASRAELHDKIMDVLTTPQQKVMVPVLRAYPRDLAREDIAKAAGYEPTSGGFGNLVGQLRALTLVDFPKKGHVKAADFLFSVR